MMVRVFFIGSIFLWVCSCPALAQSISLPKSGLDFENTNGPIRFVEVKFFEGFDSTELMLRLKADTYHRIDSTLYDKFGNETKHSSGSDYHSFQTQTFSRYRDSLLVYQVHNEAGQSLGKVMDYNRYGDPKITRYFHLNNKGKPVYDSSHTVEYNYGTVVKVTDSIFKSQMKRTTRYAKGLQQYELYRLQVERGWTRKVRKRNKGKMFQEYHDTLGFGIARFHYGGEEGNLSRAWFAKFDSLKRMTNERHHSYAHGNFNGIKYDSTLLWAFDYVYDSLDRLVTVKENRYGRHHQTMNYQYTNGNLTRVTGSRRGRNLEVVMTYDESNNLVRAEEKINQRLRMVYRFSNYDEYGNWRRCELIPYGGDQRQLRLRQIEYRP